MEPRSHGRSTWRYVCPSLAVFSPLAVPQEPSAGAGLTLLLRTLLNAAADEANRLWMNLLWAESLDHWRGFNHGAGGRFNGDQMGRFPEPVAAPLALQSRIGRGVSGRLWPGRCPPPPRSCGSSLMAGPLSWMHMHELLCVGFLRAGLTLTHPNPV